MSPRKTATPTKTTKSTKNKYPRTIHPAIKQAKTPQEKFYARIRIAEANLLKAEDAIRLHPLLGSRDNPPTHKTRRSAQYKKLKALEERLMRATTEIQNIRHHVDLLRTIDK